jgi:hypothetical protein
MDLNPGLEN